MANTAGIKYTGLDNTSAATIANTKIGTARLRQLDFRAGRPSDVSPNEFVYKSGGVANAQYHT